LESTPAGGISFTRGPLAYLLRNRFYIGEVLFKGEICPAEHPPILDRDLFEAIQQKLAVQQNGRRTRSRPVLRRSMASPHGRSVASATSR
jgi:site-specific DNA recombinase